VPQGQCRCTKLTSPRPSGSCTVRVPVPPSIAARRRGTSSTVGTAGRRLRCGGRPIDCIHGRLTLGTSRIRNKLVPRAWRCVEGDAGRCVASIVSYASTSGPPGSRGCRRAIPHDEAPHFRVIASGSAIAGSLVLGLLAFA
jgi:hypothetical protein